MFRHPHSLGALFLLSAAPVLFACEPESDILGLEQQHVERLAVPGEVTLEVGQAVRLTLALTDRDAAKRPIQWSSSDPLVASVSDRGTVQGLAEGKAIITADCGRYFVHATVTVIPAEAD
jgi:hypothetical protein